MNIYNIEFFDPNDDSTWEAPYDKWDDDEPDASYWDKLTE